jgi:4-diphosphocytidyl-2-C-methyl-D-erythritol kinase
VLARGSYFWVVAVASQGLATKDVFAEFDRLNDGSDLPQPEAPEDLLAALRAGDAAELGATLSNDLTDAALSLRPELRGTLDMGLEAEALGAVVSGSGPTCLFLAEDEAHSLDIAIALAGANVCADVIQARGPVAGARLI